MPSVEECSSTAGCWLYGGWLTDIPIRGDKDGFKTLLDLVCASNNIIPYIRLLHEPDTVAPALVSTFED